MKLDFYYYNPTKVYFGKTALNNLAQELENYGKNVLLVYGKSSIKKSGLYDKIVEILKNSGKKVYELSGIKSNPTYEQLMKGAKLVKENDVDLILAAGGGSVIDCAKGISVSAYCEGDPWKKYWIDYEEVSNKIVPVGSILTMAGTASEMNGGSVITNERELLKNGRVYPPNIYPKFSILNPEYTYTVPRYQMASGIFDTLSHLMEQYFSGEDDNTTDYIIEGVMESLINSSLIALENPNDYEARSNIMWSATMGLNTITGLSKEQDWEVHMIEHQLGAYTDCAHGVGLAVISIPYYKYIYKHGIDKFVRFAERVWKVDTKGMSKDEAALAGIEKLSDFIKKLGIDTTLKELGATKEMLPLIANSTIILDSGYKKLTSKEILDILESVY
ncbi:iron-containing alcohol dehydrogenase [Fusobacterium sp. PH5-44]|uniref:iron-containing alcohol dehydrogenase n=1 Tax=unclassified Fusobacterium TaxID=2648384 RepID=UPI003D228EB4